MEGGTWPSDPVCVSLKSKKALKTKVCLLTNLFAYLGQLRSKLIWHQNQTQAINLVFFFFNSCLIVEIIMYWVVRNLIRLLGDVM